jgi:hypothetical protein
MKTPPDYNRIADEVQRVLLKRLGHPTDGRDFALVVLSALIRDNKLSNLLFDKIY